MTRKRCDSHALAHFPKTILNEIQTPPPGISIVRAPNTDASIDTITQFQYNVHIGEL